jgi:hypothetical protein
MSKFLEMAAQQVGQTVVQKVSQNPQAAIATGIAAAKTVGAAVVVAAPYVLIGGAIIGGIYALSKL